MLAHPSTRLHMRRGRVHRMLTRSDPLPSPNTLAPRTAGAGLAAAAARAGRWLLPLLLLALAWWWLLRHADFTQVLAQAARLPPWAWALAALALLGGHGLRAWRLRDEWRHHRRIGWAAALRLVLAHNAAVLLMPLRTGEAGYLWLVHRTWGVGWREAARSLLWWRVQDATVLLLLSLLLLLPLLWPASPAARTVLALCWLVAAATLAPRALAGVDRVLLRRHPGAPAGQAVGGAAEAAASMPAMPCRQWREPRAGFGIALAIWSTKVLVLGALLGALTGLAPEAAWRVALGGELGGVMPLQGPAGLGNYEAGAWLAAPGPRLPAGSGATLIAAVLTVHGFSVALALTAAALAQLLPGGRHR